MFSRRRLKRIATAPLVLLAALLIFLEEVVWDALDELFGVLARWSVWARLEDKVRHLPVWAALPVFLLPMATLFPLKLAALWLMSHHHIWFGLELILAAKVIGTMVAARLFMLLKPTLLTVPWFARLYAAFLHWRSRIFARLHQMAWWQAAHQIMLGLRQQIASWRSRDGTWRRFRRKIKRWRRRAADKVQGEGP